MSRPFEVVSVNVSEARGTPKRPVPAAEIGPSGVAGDAHAGPGGRQVSLLGVENIGRFSEGMGRSMAPGEFAENLTTRGVDLGGVALLDRFRIGRAVLEVSQIGKECHGEQCAIFREVGRCVMPREGIFCRVVTPGPVRPGDTGEFQPRTLRLRLITLSDRASRGEYEDRTGPRARTVLEEFFKAKRWHVEISADLLPDDAGRLGKAIDESRDRGVDALFTLGSTGVGPRDIAPEVVAAACGKIIPGVMEAVRAKFGAANPRAWLSRSVAGLSGQMLVYALPGSVRAAEEYLGEILGTLEHLLLMVHGVDAH
jgi:molybdenum cofactor synthesis domain-containing protein